MTPSTSIYGNLNLEPRWYALATRYQHEKKIHAQLQQKRVHSFLPLYESERRWSDRRKKIAAPLFSCYVFVKIALQERLAVLQTEGALRLVSFNHIPAPIPESQIEALRRLVEEKVCLEPVHEWPARQWQAGQPVEVIAGPLQGLRGVFQKKHGHAKLVIAIEALRQAIAVEMDAAWVKSVGESG